MDACSDTTLERLEKILGKGSYGTVYQTKDNQAIKVVDMNQVPVPCLIEPFIMNSISHPHLMKSIKTIHKDNQIQIYQELATCNLAEYLERTPTLCFKQLVKWMYQILSALEFMHNCGFIHGDVKACNILIMSDGNVKLADFTLSTKIGWRNKYNVCTYTHRPPEVWSGSSWNEKVDIWAFGCTMYEVFYQRSLMPVIPDPEERRTKYIEILANDKFATDLDPLFKKMLVRNANLRPSCSILLKDPLFSGYSTVLYGKPIRPPIVISPLVGNILDDMLPKEYLRFKKEIATLASQIMSSIPERDFSTCIGSVACAYQLVLRTKDFPSCKFSSHISVNQTIVLRRSKFQISGF